MSLQVDITDRATPLLQELGGRLQDRRRMHKAIATAALPVVERKFVENSSTNRNRFGTRGGFWNRMLSGTYATGDDSSAIIRMPREVALRYFGGTVTPKASKNLAIPARAEAYGKSPRDFSDLRFVMFRSGAKALVQADQSKIGYRKGKRGQTTVRGPERGGLVFYWLVTEATITGDRDLLPTPEELADAAIESLRNYLDFRNRTS